MGRKAHTFPTERKHAVKCRCCGVEFLSARKDARTCSSACRSRLSRFHRKHKDDYMAAEQAARGLAESDAIERALQLLGKK